MKAFSPILFSNEEIPWRSLLSPLETLWGPLLHILRELIFCLLLFFLNTVLKLSYKYKNRRLGRTIYFNAWSLKHEIRCIVFFQVCDFSEDTNRSSVALRSAGSFCEHTASSDWMYCLIMCCITALICKDLNRAFSYLGFELKNVGSSW